MLYFKPSRIMMSFVSLCVRVSCWTLNRVCDNDVLDPPLCRQTAVGWNGKDHFGSCRSTKMIKFVSFERRKKWTRMSLLLFKFFCSLLAMWKSYYHHHYYYVCCYYYHRYYIQACFKAVKLEVQSREFEWKSVVTRMLCAFSIQKLPRLLVVNLEGMMFIYNLDPNESGECQLVRQHRLVG